MLARGATLPGNVSFIQRDTNFVSRLPGEDSVSRAAVLRLIRDVPGTTRVQLTQRLGLSPSTASRIVSRLLEDELLLEGPTIERMAVGRRPTALSFNRAAYHLAGVEISGTCLTAALANLDGELSHQRSFELPPRGGTAALRVVLDAIQAIVDAAEQDGLNVRGIGIGAPGVTDFARGRVAWAPSLAWRDLMLRDEVEQRFNVPTFVENDVNLAAVGEYWLGAGRGSHSMAYVHVSDGIGAGLILGGELLRGHHHIAGEVGHVLPDRATLAGSFTEVGAMESVASTVGLGERLTRHTRAGRTSVLEAGRPLTPAHVLAAARDDDAVAADLAEELLDHVAMMLTAVMAVVDPEVVVLGGDLAGAGEWVLNELSQRLNHTLPAWGEIRLSSLGAAAGVLGASALALLEVEHLHPRPRPVSYA